jgi:hypothetical protein
VPEVSSWIIARKRDSVVHVAQTREFFTSKSGPRHGVLFLRRALGYREWRVGLRGSRSTAWFLDDAGG